MTTFSVAGSKLRSLASLNPIVFRDLVKDVKTVILEEACSAGKSSDIWERGYQRVISSGIPRRFWGPGTGRVWDLGRDRAQILVYLSKVVKHISATTPGFLTATRPPVSRGQDLNLPVNDMQLPVGNTGVMYQQGLAAGPPATDVIYEEFLVAEALDDDDDSSQASGEARAKPSAETPTHATTPENGTSAHQGMLTEGRGNTNYSTNFKVALKEPSEQSSHRVARRRSAQEPKPSEESSHRVARRRSALEPKPAAARRKSIWEPNPTPARRIPNEEPNLTAAREKSGEDTKPTVARKKSGKDPSLTVAHKKSGEDTSPTVARKKSGKGPSLTVAHKKSGGDPNLTVVRKKLNEDPNTGTGQPEGPKGGGNVSTLHKKEAPPDKCRFCDQCAPIILDLGDDQLLEGHLAHVPQTESIKDLLSNNPRSYKLFHVRVFPSQEFRLISTKGTPSLRIFLKAVRHIFDISQVVSFSRLTLYLSGRDDSGDKLIWPEYSIQNLGDWAHLMEHATKKSCSIGVTIELAI